MTIKSKIHALSRQAAFLLPALIFASCRDDVAWTETHAIDEDGWLPDCPAVFELDPVAYEPEVNRFTEMTNKALGDTIARLRGRYHADLSLRFRDDCNSREVTIVVEHASLDAEISCDTITYRLIGTDGNPLGSGRFGLHEVTQTLPAPLIVGEGTRLSVAPIGYSSPPEGILSATLLVKNPYAP